MSRIEGLLAQILAAVYGRDVRQSIHDAIEECYTNVSTAKTIADDSAADARSAATESESRTTAAIGTMQTAVNTAVGNANTATTNANTAATNANTKAGLADTAASAANQAKDACDAAVAAIPDELEEAMDGLGLVVVNGRLCVKVERYTTS